MLDTLATTLRDLPHCTDPHLVAVTGASNVTGEIWPIARIAEVAHEHEARLLVDAAQLAPHAPIDMARDGIDYLALIACLRAVGTEPNPSLVLLAYVAASLLGMLPFTPGGLGFVEAGLVGMLVLAGVGATDAAVATLAYRLVSFWLPIPVGGGGWALFRYRYP